MKTSSIVAVVIAIIIIAGAVWYFAQPTNTGAPAQNTTATSTQSAGGADATAGAAVSASVSTGAPMSATVTYNGSSFSPASVTVAKGGTVTFVDQSGQMWIASNPHPVHTGYDGTSASQHCAVGYAGPKPLDMCAPGSSFSFTFDKTGSWGYHDHLNHSSGGTVVVE